MKKYIFWNNKGGTGKTTLCFHSIVSYAQSHAQERILAIDLCPQANLSEILLGGFAGNGGPNLISLWNNQSGRCSIGGYFEERLSNPYTMPANLNPSEYISVPNSFNSNIPSNVSLICGDKIVELQSSFIASLSNSQRPGHDSYMDVLMWLSDLLDVVNGDYDVVFIDTNPSFSIYTQIGLAVSGKLIIPIMADDSSKRAIMNVMSLLYGINLPSPIYQQYTFSSKLQANGHSLPLIHMVAKNRITQYMGSASAYRIILDDIQAEVDSIRLSSPQFFTPNYSSQEIRDFQTTGVVAAAEAKSFHTLIGDNRVRNIKGENVQLNVVNINNCITAIDSIVVNL